MGKEIKSAVLHEKFGEHSTLIIVDEEYNIHTLTSDDATFYFMLQDVDLPNFKHRRASGSHVYEASRKHYGGYYQAHEALALIGEYRECQDVDKRTTPAFPLEVWCDDVYEFTDMTEGNEHEWPEAGSEWPEVGKLYIARSWRDDPSIRKGYYRTQDENGEEHEYPEGFFRVLRDDRRPSHAA
jgi:hypothetical protein